MVNLDIANALGQNLANSESCPRLGGGGQKLPILRRHSSWTK